MAIKINTLSKALLKRALYKRAEALDGSALGSIMPAVEQGINVGKAARTPITAAETLVGASPGVVRTTGNILGVPYMGLRGYHDAQTVSDPDVDELTRMRAGARLPNDVAGTFGPAIHPWVLPGALTYDFALDTASDLHDTYVPDAKKIYDKDRMDFHTDFNGVVDPQFLEDQTGMLGIMREVVDRADLIRDGVGYDLWHHTPELVEGAINGAAEGDRRLEDAKDRGVVNPDKPAYYGTTPVDDAGGYLNRINDDNGRVYLSDWKDGLFGPTSGRDRGKYLGKLMIEQPLQDAGDWLKSLWSGVADKRNEVGITPKELAKRKKERDMDAGRF